MPATVYIEFDIDAPVRATPSRLHAAWGRILDLPEGLAPARAARFPNLAHRPSHAVGASKPYCLGDMLQSERVFGVELRLLSDRLLDTLDAWLAWSGVLPIGDATATTLAIATGAQVLEQASWEEIAAATTATAWNLRIITPMAFRSHGAEVRHVTPATLATSLHARWRDHSPGTVPWLPERAHLESVLAIEDRTRSISVTLTPHSEPGGPHHKRRINARIGELRVSGRAGARSTRVFSQLMALARFTGVGSYTGFGMGVIDVDPDAPL